MKNVFLVFSRHVEIPARPAGGVSASERFYVCRTLGGVEGLLNGQSGQLDTNYTNYPECAIVILNGVKNLNFYDRILHNGIDLIIL